MVGVHRLLALPPPRDVSALSQVLNWIHWPQAPLAALVAIVISWICIMAGFHHKGRPFGSGKATAHTIVIIVVTAIIASLLSVLVPHLPFSMGIFIPALLCGAVLKENETIQELRTANPELAALVTIGISYLLGQLRDQMFGDRGDWCDAQIEQIQSKDQNGVEDELASLSSFAAAGSRLRTMLINRLPRDQRDETRVEDHYAAIGPAVRGARAAHVRDDADLFEEEYNKAQQALTYLLQIAYDWKYTIALAKVPAKPPAPV